MWFIKPFGDIDSPASGVTISGNLYRVNGWLLTPQPNTISFDGSTISLYIPFMAKTPKD